MKKFLVINVLSREAYDDCHISGSVNVPRDQLEQYLRPFDREATDIVVYCTQVNCALSKQAWYIAHDMGFKQVKAYEGGIREWFQKGYPVRGVCKLDSLRAPLEAPVKEDRAVATITAEDLKVKMHAHGMFKE